MASFGGVTCTFLKGTAKQLRPRVETWTVPGISGVGALILGLQDSEFRFEAVLHDTHANVIAWKNLLEALQGSIVSATDDWNTTWSGLLVERVTPVQRSPSRVSTVECRGAVLIEGKVIV